jgi:hypothetical protein
MRKVKERDVLYVMQLLEENIPFDSSPKLTLRVNNQGRQCIRCQAKTQGQEWVLDIYGQHFFWLAIPPAVPFTCDSIRSLLLNMQMRLLR